MAQQRGKAAAWLALVACVVTMVLVAYIVKSEGPVGEVGSGPFWGMFAAVLVGSAVMIVALSKAVAAQKVQQPTAPRTVDTES